MLTIEQKQKMAHEAIVEIRAMQSQITINGMQKNSSKYEKQNSEMESKISELSDKILILAGDSEDDL